MKTNMFLTEELLMTRAVETLINTLGPVETFRFLSMPRKKRIESVRRHHLWQAGLEKDTFFNKVFDE